MEEEDEPGVVNFIPCVCFVPRGVAKANPERVTLEPAELARIIQETRSDLEDVENRENGGGDNEDDDDDHDVEMDASGPSAPTNRPSATQQRKHEANVDFDFDNYDTEANGPAMAIGNIAIVDPELNDDATDSEAEDDIIKPADNLVLVGHVEDDCSNMEVYLYNESEESLYVHHDFLLPAFPLCIEWMNYDPGSPTDGNMCAIGSMDPVITLWDLDIQDSLEPIMKLGRKTKKNKPGFGHTDAVLDMSWNKNFSHILASGSVDQSVIFWDLESGEPHTTIKSFDEKVQCIDFQPNEAKSLLAGSCDGFVKLFDCRDLETINTSFKKWKLDTEIERVCWNYADANYFMASTNSGNVYMIDVRVDDVPVWTHKCHEQETTGLIISAHIPGMLTTTSADGLLKVWDFTPTEINLVYTQALKIGKVQCLDVSPENPFTMAVGGDFRKKHFKVVELNHEAVTTRFGNRPRISNAVTSNETSME